MGIEELPHTSSTRCHRPAAVGYIRLSMQKSWFTCRVKYVKLTESGREEKATDSYVLDAHSYTEAEARITQIMMQSVKGVFQIQNIAKSNFAEVIRFDDAEKWFKVKVSLVSFDEESGREKQSNQFLLMTANDVQDAYLKTGEVMRGSISGYVIPAISFTKIVDVFPLAEEDEADRRMREEGLKPLSEVIGQDVPGPPQTPLQTNEAMVDPESGEIIG